MSRKKMRKELSQYTQERVELATKLCDLIDWLLAHPIPTLKRQQGVGERWEGPARAAVETPPWDVSPDNKEPDVDSWEFDEIWESAETWDRWSH